MLFSNYRSGDNIDKLCGRRPSSESADGYEYALHYKGLSYLHLEWVTRQKLEQIEFKGPGTFSRFMKKIENCDQDPDSEIMFVNNEYYVVDSILDCVDAIIEVNPDLYIPGWRMLSMDEELPPKTKIYNLPQTWRERLGKTNPSKSSMEKVKRKSEDLSGKNPYSEFYKSISRFIPEDETSQVPDANGSIFLYERVYLVKWTDMSISEATWERGCDIQGKDQIDAFFDMSTMPPSYYRYYKDYLPENYITQYDKEKDLSVYEPVLTTMPAIASNKNDEDAMPRRRGRANKSNGCFKRRVKNLRNCIDPIAPPFDKGIDDSFDLMCS